ncbi:polysaccharide biosynthesis protein [Coprobacter secundus]|uniref:Capsular polysaccharide biosynthesis protein CapD n=1 Tax=Coprobacter secundus subsp. similis TaxID=2751153 RepID=A0A7G1I0J4_9BACT|nr:nucleoside-diphosphate sugar epimerase/dehydratase [Coprobacter secundus]BCI63247.1 capsular polysaccharide biosynthesis protein CapD [Coprobacter secundus subsp. similis]
MAIRKTLQTLVNSKYVNRWVILLADVLISVFCSLLSCLFVSYIARLSVVPGEFIQVLLLSTFSTLLSYLIWRTYRSIIRHTTLKELWRLGVAVFCKVVILFLLILTLNDDVLTIRQLILTITVDFSLSIIALIAFRVILLFLYDAVIINFYPKQTPILIYGIGQDAVAVATMLPDKKYRVMGFLTIGKQYESYRILGHPVLQIEDYIGFENLRKRYGMQAILFPDQKSVREEQDRIIRYCGKDKVKILIAQPIEEAAGNTIKPQKIQEVRIEDLLMRDEIEISMSEVMANFQGKVIMVTGAAGSIGSELCRQLATFHVKQLVLFDSAETPMHNLRLELEERFPDLYFVPVIGDVRQEARVNFAMRKFHPQIIFHAAAYKHVPLMEENPCEAVLVNVKGTACVANYAVSYGVEKFIMVSTDKAVNPTNVMGASKRLAEIYVQSLSVAIGRGQKEGKTRFITTRFGNVLGSNGSVIPRFRAQIEKGGPVTVTHPDIIRYFMTIPEACRLVMEAATMGRGDEIFIFEMGEPVKIANLARRMIELAGFEPDKDIKIEYTGLRPGEKLYEELLSNEENTKPTTHKKIRIADVRQYDYEEVARAIEKLSQLSLEVRIPDTVRLMKKIVPEFKSNNSIYEQYDRELKEEAQVEEGKVAGPINA